LFKKAFRKFSKNPIVGEIKEVVHEGVGHSKKVVKKINKQRGLKKVTGLLCIGVLAAAIAIIPVVPTIIAIGVVGGRIGFRKLEKFRNRKNAKK
jgi:hypothetical protein